MGDVTREQMLEAALLEHWFHAPMYRALALDALKKALAMPVTAQEVDVASWEAGRDAAAAVAETRWKAWNDGDGFHDADGFPAVECDVSACENIASAIRSLTPPAPWSPPPEAERPERFECLGRVGVETLHIRWHNAPLRTSTDTYRGWFAVERFSRVYPDAFFPLPE